MSAALAEAVAEHAEGALVAQRFVADLRDQRTEPSGAFDRLMQLVDRHGSASPAVAGFLNELAKHCR